VAPPTTIPNIAPDFYVEYRRIDVKIVNSPELPEPSGFSHAVLTGDAIYLAGQTGAGETIAEQFDNAAANLIAALAAAGGGPSDLAWLQVFVTDIDAYRASLPELGLSWRRRFGRHYPAMGLFGVTGLFDPTSMVELMGIAVLNG
jgi:enamine deaminase RidA (YjgF/YER057c/UK114 family)